MIYETPEETPGYAGLYGEVVTTDCYDLKKLQFVPDVIIDLGANIGVFTRYARELFPNAIIVSIEPHPDNFIHLMKFTSNTDKWFPVPAAVGVGQLWHNKGAVNGSGESYVSSGIGYDHSEMEQAEHDNAVEKSEIRTLLPKDLFHLFVKEGDKVLVKMDIEGGEHAVFADEESMKLLRSVDYFCAELHLYALHGGELYNTMAKKMGEAIASFMPTHNVKLDNVHFSATKK